ncbi:FAD-binding protein [Qingshengfaniella alkalisoli]|uniref:FAD-binding protein n=1 Tax=Qingshengfaniella alkalisoli TaxID=2599296 RepID=UPI00197B70D3
MRPASESELADIIRDTPDPLAIQGGGTRGIAREGKALTTSALTGITLYEPGALTLVVKAGTTVAEIEKTLDTEGQRLAFEPMDHRGLLGTEGTPTIGGVVAANVSGPRRIQTGACRDHLLGVRFVDGRGEIVKNGGRVMKNVTGYDLVKLMGGSFGTLGVLTEVSLKVLPKPEAVATVILSDLTIAQAVQAMSAALGSPYDVTGVAHLPEARQTIIRLEGFGNSVSYRAQKLEAALGRFGAAGIATDFAEESDRWRAVRNVDAFHGKAGDVWKISVKPTDAPALVSRLDGTQTLLDWGGGLVWALVPEGTALRARMDGIAGHATRVRGSNDSGPVFHPQPAAVETLASGLRQQFDPQGILNPGLMG